MKIKIIAISDSEKHFEQAIKEYEKRLWKELEIIKIKPDKNWTTQTIIKGETEKIIKAIGKDVNYKILLSLNWNNIDTINLAKIINQEINITFIIGGPYWLDEDILDKHVDKKISFGNITLPHPLAKLVLIEQIYRCKTIIDNKTYHY